MNESVIQAEDISFAYGLKSVFRHLDVQILRGSIYGLLGPNGCGKSTLLRLILGQGRPYSGSIRVWEEDPNLRYVSVRSRIGYVPQENDLDPQLTVEETLALFASFYPRRWNTETADRQMTRLGLEDKGFERVGKLSAGWKQRLALVTAVAIEPEILLLDEPTAGLDAVVRRDFTETVIDYMAGGDGRTVVICSHLLSEIEPLIDHIGLIASSKQGGRMLVESTLGELKERALIAEFDSPGEEWSAHPALLSWGSKSTLVFWAETAEAESALRGGIQETGGRVVEQADLDEIFVHLFREAVPVKGRRIVDGKMRHAE